MPPQSQKQLIAKVSSAQLEILRKLATVAMEIDFPIEALHFVQSGLEHTVKQVHGETSPQGTCRHISGQQLCLGLRDYARQRWGMLAPLVLRKWNITRTQDFGRIVFSLVNAGVMKTTENDSPDDFRDVFNFSTLGAGYRIESKI